jgi:hypothetical protein
MPPLKNYNLFISHGWNYNDDYERLVLLLNKAPNFKWRNYSVSENDPLAGGSRKKLSKEIDNQIRLTSVVLVIARMYVAYRSWIKYEIDLADKYDKPIIGIQPVRSIYTPTILQRDDIEIVKWTTKSIVKAIRRNAI